ncbi:hypothetical protein [Bradyrhizobium ivorense]|uniref:hypothetical protein n=1 Tax=Bradyrhizobium ivorense TaxID=2511166 RepID=UPI0010B3639F|nr:hypothetical protein [Bradyrhizobium ivorense]VIO73779.1 hypothetical protein CI41S_38860 [Bradyrhizobium ivorense]
MKVLCIETKLSDEQRLESGCHPSTTFAVTKERTYLVLGIWYAYQSPQIGSGVFLFVVGDHGYPIPVPLVFFDVVDPRPSCKWTLTKYNDHEASLLPLELQDKFFIDRLTDGERSDVEAFKKLLVDLENEFEPI